jgi:hypothetical protein
VSRAGARRIAAAVLLCSVLIIAAAVGVFRLTPGQAPLLAPVVLAFACSGLALLSIRAHERAERPDPSG